jgi:anti-sigma factor RsiW
MACEKYSDSMIDVAAGNIHPRRERELLLHVGECEACREAYQHAREVTATLDRSVEALVAGEPSAYFAARLRRRIAKERVCRSTSWNDLALTAMGALVALILVLILMSHLAFHTDSVAPVATNLPTPARKGSDEVPSLIPLEAVSNPQLRPVSHPSRTEPLSAEVLVPRGQLIAALQLGDAVNIGTVNGEQLVAAQSEITEQIEVKPLEIVPLESLDANPAGDGPTHF